MWIYWTETDQDGSLTYVVGYFTPHGQRQGVRRLSGPLAQTDAEEWVNYLNGGCTPTHH